ncbi:MAG TPA: alkane oxidation protein activator PraB [Dyella sp.]|uniref:alkane oxidation protein activator PraB n=1 Tax=Dyella sp. TaxID=1869338 RepID=UPI002F937360
MNGKNVLRLAASLLMIGSIHAHATKIGPAGSPFSATGTMVMRASGAAPTCNVTLSGVVLPDGSQAVINSVSVSGGLLCGNAKVKGLPWSIQAISPWSAFINGVAFDVPPFSRCGPATVNAQWNNNTNTLSVVRQPLGGNCTMETLSISPNPAFIFSDNVPAAATP